MDHPGDRISELDLRVADAMPANHRALGLHHFGKAAGQNLFQDRDVSLIRKANNRQRAERLAAHGIHVAERVDGRDLAKGKGIIHNRSKEIDSLHQCLLGGDSIHSGVVGFVKANQHVLIMLPG